MTTFEPLFDYGAAEWSTTSKVLPNSATCPGEEGGVVIPFPVKMPPPRVVPSRRHAVRSEPPLRLTPRGRIVFGLLLSLMVLAVTACGLALTGHAEVQPRYITVQPGETLSQVAARELPDIDVSDAVFRIQQANDLPMAQVHAGIRLAIPGQ